MDTTNIHSVTKVNSLKAASVSPVQSSDIKVGAETAGKVLPLIEKQTEMLTKDNKKIEEKVSELNSYVQNIQRGIQFSVHDDTGRSVISITDKDTGEEIRRFPSDQVLAIAEHIAETLAVPEELGLGLIVNGKA